MKCIPNVGSYDERCERWRTEGFDPDEWRAVADAVASQSKLKLSTHRASAERLAFAYKRGELSDVAEMQRRVRDMAEPYLEWLDLDLMATHIRAIAERMDRQAKGGGADGD